MHWPHKNRAVHAFSLAVQKLSLFVSGGAASGGLWRNFSARAAIGLVLFGGRAIIDSLIGRCDEAVTARVTQMTCYPASAILARSSPLCSN
jgi:hypothetical protein